MASGRTRRLLRRAFLAVVVALPALHRDLGIHAARDATSSQHRARAGDAGLLRDPPGPVPVAQGDNGCHAAPVGLAAAVLAQRRHNRAAEKPADAPARLLFPSRRVALPLAASFGG